MKNTTYNESLVDNKPLRARLVATEMRKDNTYIRVYLICMNFLVQIVIPFAVLIIFNWLTYRTMKESEKTLLQNIRVHYKSQTRLNQEQVTIVTEPIDRSPKSNSTAKNKATSLRKREVILSKISIYIVFVFLFCHSVRIVPNIYEMICTYTKVSLALNEKYLSGTTSAYKLLDKRVRFVLLFIYSKTSILVIKASPPKYQITNFGTR